MRVCHYSGASLCVPMHNLPLSDSLQDQKWIRGINWCLDRPVMTHHVCISPTELEDRQWMMEHPAVRAGTHTHTHRHTHWFHYYCTHKYRQPFNLQCSDWPVKFWDLWLGAGFQQQLPCWAGNDVSWPMETWWCDFSLCLSDSAPQKTPVCPDRVLWREKLWG